jgi:hypothetical protein
LPARRNVQAIVAACLAVVVVIVVVVVVVAARRETGAGAGGVPTSAANAAAGCVEQRQGPAFVRPRVTTEGSSLDLTFCPVVVNGAQLPITGPFELSGQVLGPASERARVVVVTYGDARTCDALGNRAAPGGFFVDQARVGSPDGQWSYVDDLGYAEAVTIARQYRYVTASADSIVTMKGDAAAWVAAHPNNPDDYPGILALPADATVLATFDVPGGTYAGAQPCK